jgi:RNA polymerase sigma-70 factor (ECF subfamily)
VGDSDEAMDVSQEAFIRVYRARKKYDETKSFFSWFYTILSNLAKNCLKKGRVRAEYRKTVQNKKMPNDNGRAFSPDLILEADETKRLVWEAIEKLSFEHREIIVLRHFEDFSYEEIAKAVGVPIGSVMSRLYYARKQLKEILGEISE